MVSIPVVTCRLLAPVPMPGLFPKLGSMRLPAGSARSPLSVKIDLNRDRFSYRFKFPVGRFATQSLFAEIPWRLELKREMDVTVPEDWGDSQTEFPYPFYIEDEDWAAPKKTKKTTDKADAEDYEIAAQRIIRFPQPANRGADLAKSLRRKPRRQPPFLRGAKLFSKIR